MFLTKWNGIPDEGEKVSDKSKVEPFFVTVQEQVERLLLAGQNLVDERAYEFLAKQDVPEDYVPLLMGSDIVDVEKVMQRLNKKLEEKRRLKELENGGMDKKPDVEDKAEN